MLCQITDIFDIPDLASSRLSLSDQIIAVATMESVNDVVDENWGKNGEDAPSLWVEWVMGDDEVPPEIFEDWEPENGGEVESAQDHHQKLPKTTVLSSPCKVAAWTKGGQNEEDDDDSSAAGKLFDGQPEMEVVEKNCAVVKEVISTELKSSCRSHG